MIGSTHDRSHKDQTIVMGITDLMTSLAVIFILLLTLFIKSQFAAREASQDIRQMLINAITKRLEGAKDAELRQVLVQKDQNDPLAVTVVIKNRQLGFAPDERQLPDQGKKFLRLFVPHLVAVVCQEQVRNIQTIVVEGHTDPTAPSGEDPDRYNIPLSQDRARSVMQYSIDLLAGEDGRDCLLNLTSVNGRGQRERPEELAGKELSTQDYEPMRRVVFKIRIKSTEQREETGQLQANVRIENPFIAGS